MEMRMRTDTAIWCHNKYGGAPVSEVMINDDSIEFTGDGTKVAFYCGTEEEVISLKNMILWAFEKFIREQKARRDDNG